MLRNVRHAPAIARDPADSLYFSLMAFATSHQPPEGAPAWHQKIHSFENQVRKHLRALTVLGLAALSIAGGDAFAAGMCSSTPGTGNHIKCMEGSSSTTNIDIDAMGVDIDFTGIGATEAISGVQAFHDGNANIDLNFSGTTTGMTTTASMIDTMGPNTHGIFGRLRGDGALTITLQDTEIGTQGNSADGLRADHQGTGALTVNLETGTMINTQGSGAYLIRQNQAQGEGGDIILNTNGASVATAGNAAYGLHAFHQLGTGGVTATIRDSSITTQGSEADGIFIQRIDTSRTDPGNIVIDVHDSTIRTETTTGTGSDGIQALHQNTGNIDIDVQGGSLTTAGTSAVGIYGLHQGTGNIEIDLQGDSTTTGANSHGVFGWHASNGNVNIGVQGGSIKTEGTGLLSAPNPPITHSHGIYGLHQGTGNVQIDAQGGSIITAGTNSYGIYGRMFPTASGDLSISTGEGHTITTTGPSGHGIVGFHHGTAATGSMAVTVGGLINVSGAGARGVQMGTISNGAPARMAAIGDDGYRQQTVTVNGAITSAAEGVYLAGGGKVIIGPSGSITSGSGIAILATGTVPAVDDNPATMDVNEAMPEILPKLRVDLNPDGAQMTGDDGWLATALGGGWIINDGGGTTIAVNDVVLHEAATGVVADVVAHNGAWDVTLQARGRTVTDRTTDPWMIAARAAGVIADRDFNAEDFAEAAGRCPKGQVGTRPNCRVPPPPPSDRDPEPDPEPEPEPEPKPAPPVFMEKYAPRAALYEALPDFLLGLHTDDLAGGYRFAPGLPVWVELLGSSRSRDFDHSTVSTNYDAERFVVKGGTRLHGQRWRFGVSLHYVTGSANVASPVKGGDIQAQGAGLGLDAYWHNPNDYYATGRFAWTNYALDIASDTVGRLISELDADRLAWHAEAGRRMQWGEQLHWTPHVRLAHTRVEVDRFTDTVGAQVSVPVMDRYRGSLGVQADTVRSAWGGDLSLWGSLDLERLFGNVATTTWVSGERLRAEAQANSLLLTLGAVWQRGPWVLNAAFSAREAPGAGSGGSREYTGALNIGVQF